MAFCILTGVAGFIGSHLAEALIARGHEVIGIDCFTDYYSPAIKRANLKKVAASTAFTLSETDLATGGGLPRTRVDYVFHLAAQPGVRASWGAGFEAYVRNNVLATQRLLEGLRGHDVRGLVIASSSSVYGAAQRLPIREEDPKSPISPYGVTKLAMEALCSAYERAFAMPVTVLRFFTVYGPRQRPDMAFSGFFRRILRGQPIPIYGTGAETRDYTFVEDAVRACLACLDRPVQGHVFNISGGSRISLNDCVEAFRAVTGLPVSIERLERQGGDPPDTHADGEKARTVLGYSPSVAFEAGLARQWEWIRSLEALPSGSDP